MKRSTISGSAKPSIVLAHGIWADASSFNRVIPVLQQDGYEVVAAQCSLDSLSGDVEAVKRSLRRVSGPTILVGHSYGGTVITAAGMDDRVAGLVYLAALAPDADETSQSLQDRFPAGELFKHNHVEVSDGRLWMKQEAVACFASDLPESKQKLIWATHAAPVADLFSQRVEGTAWRTKPSWYVVAKEDRVGHPELQRFCARRMGATVFETGGGHTSMLLKPDLVVRVIRQAADTISASHDPSARVRKFA